MAPKNKFTKQQLIDTAFEIACNQGYEGITIRKIAEHLGSSIAPIYSNFKDVEQLKTAVTEKSIEIYEQLVKQQDFNFPFLNAGMASVIFAKKYPLIYDDLILKTNPHYDYTTQSKPFIISQMKQQPDLSHLTDTELDEILLKMQAFQIGLSVLARDKNYADTLTDDKVMDMLKNIGEVIIADIAKEKSSND